MLKGFAKGLAIGLVGLFLGYVVAAVLQQAFRADQRMAR